MFARSAALRAAILIVCFCASAFAAPKAQHVFIISIDQGGDDAIEKADMPFLKKLAAEGAHTWEAYTIVPSLTLPSHTSMLTGVGIQKHQVDWNDFVVEKGLVKVPTIFSLAKKAGLSTAMVVGKSKFKTLQLPGSLDRFEKTGKTAAEVATAVDEMLKTFRPGLCFIHFADPDVQGHKYGAHSAEKMKALAETDEALRKIVDAIQKSGIADSSVLIITADHGSHDIPNPKADEPGEPKVLGTHGSPHTRDVLIPWIAYGSHVKPRFTITAPVVQYDTAATALWLLGVPIPESFWGRPVTSAFD